jgi:hypothetical protein
MQPMTQLSGRAATERPRRHELPWNSYSDVSEAPSSGSFRPLSDRAGSAMRRADQGRTERVRGSSVPRTANASGRLRRTCRSPRLVAWPTAALTSGLRFHAPVERLASDRRFRGKVHAWIEPKAVRSPSLFALLLISSTITAHGAPAPLGAAYRVHFKTWSAGRCSDHTPDRRTARWNPVHRRPMNRADCNTMKSDSSGAVS